jgi:hypothetical protein
MGIAWKAAISDTIKRRHIRNNAMKEFHPWEKDQTALVCLSPLSGRADASFGTCKRSMIALPTSMGLALLEFQVKFGGCPFSADAEIIQALSAVELPRIFWISHGCTSTRLQWLLQGQWRCLRNTFLGRVCACWGLDYHCTWFLNLLCSLMQYYWWPNCKIPLHLW